MDMSINQRLANFLYEKKISQEELRIKLGLKTRQQVSNWLNCRDPGIGDHYGKQRINGHWHDFDMPQCRLRQ